MITKTSPSKYKDRYLVLDSIRICYQMYKIHYNMAERNMEDNPIESF